jgi:hypothetical protein
LTDLANWRARGELSVPVVDRLHALALRIPGASSAAFAATTTTTTTAPVQVVVPEDLKKRKKDNGDNKQD